MSVSNSNNRCPESFVNLSCDLFFGDSSYKQTLPHEERVGHDVCMIVVGCAAGAFCCQLPQTAVPLCCSTILPFSAVKRGAFGLWTADQQDRGCPDHLIGRNVANVKGCAARCLGMSPASQQMK